MTCCQQRRNSRLSLLRVPFIAVFTKDAYTRTISSHSSPASFSPCPFPYQGHPLTFPPDNGGRACAVQLTRIVYARAHTNVPTLGAGAGWRGHLKKVKRTPETATARPRQFYCALKNTHGGFRVRRNEEIGNLFFKNFIYLFISEFP